MNPNGSISSRIRTAGSRGSRLSSSWISSLNSSSFDRRSGHRNAGGASERNATRTVLREIPYRRASSRTPTPRTKCSRRSSAQRSTSSTTFLLARSPPEPSEGPRPPGQPQVGQISTARGGSEVNRCRHEGAITSTARKSRAARASVFGPWHRPRTRASAIASGRLTARCRRRASSLRWPALRLWQPPPRSCEGQAMRYSTLRDRNLGRRRSRACCRPRQASSGSLTRPHCATDAEANGHPRRLWSRQPQTSIARRCRSSSRIASRSRRQDVRSNRRSGRGDEGRVLARRGVSRGCSPESGAVGLDLKLWLTGRRRLPPFS